MKRGTQKFIGMKLIAFIICGFFLFQTIGCGTLIYPERRGQKAGKVDVHVAILDGLGLLLFIIPGVVAFAVDFATGAIYLPGSRKAGNSQGHSDKIVKLNADQMKTETITHIVSQHTGQAVDFDSPDMLAFKPEGSGMDVFSELDRLEASCSPPSAMRLCKKSS